MLVAVAVALAEIVTVFVLTAVMLEPEGIPAPEIKSPTSKAVPSSTVMSADPFVVSAVASVKTLGFVISTPKSFP
jgi:hypothetical protein